MIYGGAGLCLAGLKLLQALGVTKKNLVPCDKIVTAIGGSEISCLGWLPIIFKIHDNIIIQPLYTCDKADKLYFSRKGCLKTNMLPALFPFPMLSKEQESVQSVLVDSPSVPNHQDMSQIVNQNMSHMLKPVRTIYVTMDTILWEQREQAKCWKEVNQMKLVKFMLQNSADRIQ